MNEKVKRKFFTAMLVAFAVLAVMVANASAEEVAWAQSVVNYTTGCWNNPENILGPDDDKYANISYDSCDSGTIIVDMGTTFSNGTMYVNRHYAEQCAGDRMAGFDVYVSPDCSNWTFIGTDGCQNLLNDSDFEVSFSNETRYVKIEVAVFSNTPCLDSVRISGELPDTTPPASITDLINTTGNFWINWTWTNPTDADFNYTMVYIDGVFVTNTSSNYYNSTYSPHATRTISTRTVDTAGNINSTWVNQTTTIPNNVPVLEAIGDKMVDEGQALTIDVNASDLDGDTLTYSCNRTDLFTDFDSATGIGSWTPGYDDAGVYYVDFGVSDGEGGVDNETVKITVNDVTLPAPKIISYAPPTPVSDDEGATRTFNISVDQTVNVSWLINGTVVQTNESVTEASCTNTSAVAGYWNVSAVATNENGTAIQTWWWSVNYTAAGICGDVNGDGYVTVYDKTVLALYIGEVPGWELNCG